MTDIDILQSTVNDLRTQGNYVTVYASGEQRNIWGGEKITNQESLSTVLVEFRIKYPPSRAGTLAHYLQSRTAFKFAHAEMP